MLASRYQASTKMKQLEASQLQGVYDTTLSHFLRVGGFNIKLLSRITISKTGVFLGQVFIVQRNDQPYFPFTNLDAAVARFNLMTTRDSDL